ncbi:MAG: cysteine--tRNA ligase [Candidatus Paceibacterota bacterium]|jgi:cysteinyl-tRNA synthetase
MNIQLYNTLSGKKEVFKPLINGEVSMYNCGPTIYDRLHVGNFRAAFTADLLHRVMEYNDYKIKHITNITDVGHLVGDGDAGDDKMTKALKRNNMPMTLEAMREVATMYFNEFVKDLEKLNIKMPDKFTRASDHIEEDIELIKELEVKGFVYKTSDGLYFDTSKFKGYGKLGNIKIETLKEGARVAENTEKKNPSDFALWKFDSKLGWETPWGKGFPGWHIECSAMSTKYLGQPFDIHAGAIDLIATHHNNEIAQSEAAHDKPLANYWVHNEFLVINNEKMAKSVGNVVNIDTLIEQSISPLSFRYWLLTAHYRSPVNFTFEAVKASQNALIKLMNLISSYPDGGSLREDYKNKFLAFINDDIDTAKALALTWELVKDDSVSDADKKATVLNFDQVFGLKLDSIPKVETEEIPDEIIVLSEAREEARKNKEWEKADALRNEIEARGYEISDTASGIKISRK